MLTTQNKLPVNEKLIETLFNAAALRYLGTRASLYTPTTREEFVEGYDACYKPGSGHAPLFLQFKAIHEWQKESWGKVSLTPAQHKTLWQKCRPGTAFYVVTTLKSVAEVHRAWGQAQEEPLSFLDYFAAVSVTKLDAEAKGFTVKRRGPFGRADDHKPSDVSHPQTQNGDFPFVSGKTLMRDFDMGRSGQEDALIDRESHEMLGNVAEHADQHDNRAFVGSLFLKSSTVRASL